MSDSFTLNETRPPEPLALIIEDDEKIATIYSAAIRQAGFTTHIAGDGITALKELSQFQPRLVVLDLRLPGISGETILHAIRRHPRLAQTPVIITTADAVLADKLQDEGDLVLVKPVSFVQLRDLAKRLVKT